MCVCVSVLFVVDLDIIDSICTLANNTTITPSFCSRSIRCSSDFFVDIALLTAFDLNNKFVLYIRKNERVSEHVFICLSSSV